MLDFWQFKVRFHSFLLKSLELKLTFFQNINTKDLTMSGAEESTMSSVARAQACITDCSILNQTSCQPVTRRQLVTSADQVREMW